MRIGSPNLEKLVCLLVDEFNEHHYSIKKTELNDVDDSTIYEGLRKNILCEVDGKVSLSESMIHHFQKWILS